MSLEYVEGSFSQITDKSDVLALHQGFYVDVVRYTMNDTCHYPRTQSRTRNLQHSKVGDMI